MKQAVCRNSTREESNVLKEKQLTGSNILANEVSIKACYVKTPKKITNENKALPTSAKTSGAFKSKIALPINPMHSAHLCSHHQQEIGKVSTPTNRSTKIIFGSSSKHDSSSKDNSARKITNSAKIALAKTSKVNTLLTPSNRCTPMSASNKSNSKLVEATNTIGANGVDYSQIMARKAELGYHGPGYVVEYECELKDLKTVYVNKGLWRISCFKQTPDKALNKYLGVPLFGTRLDTEEKKPSTKSIFPEVDFNWSKVSPEKTTEHFNISNGPNHTTIDFFHDSEGDMLYLEQSKLTDKKQPQAKKSLRWADKLECIEETANNTLVISPYRNMSPSLDMNQLVGLKSKNNSGGDKGGPCKKTMRRSFSMNDMNNLLLDQDDDEPGVKILSPYCSNETKETPALNETFDLDNPSAIDRVKLTQTAVGVEIEELIKQIEPMQLLNDMPNILADDLTNNKAANKKQALFDLLQSTSDKFDAFTHQYLNLNSSPVILNNGEYLRITNLIANIKSSINCCQKNVQI